MFHEKKKEVLFSTLPIKNKTQQPKKGGRAGKKNKKKTHTHTYTRHVDCFLPRPGTYYVIYGFLMPKTKVYE